MMRARLRRSDRPGALQALNSRSLPWRFVRDEGTLAYVITSDRRRKPRVPVKIEVSVIFGDDAETGEIINISEGGFFLKTTRAFDVGTKAKLQFVIRPEQDLCVAHGKVVWQSPSGLGIELDHSNEAYEKHVRKLEIIASVSRQKQAWLDRLLPPDVELG